MLLSISSLVQDGYLDSLPSGRAQPASQDQVDFVAREAYKTPLLRAAYLRFVERGRLEEIAAFEAPRPWLHTFAVYSALRESRDHPWWEWDAPLRTPAAVRIEPGTPFAHQVAYHKFLQLVFTVQWDRLRAYAHGRGIRIWGDLPIFVDRDSADVWANQHLYKLDDHGNPTVVSGVPPDAFSDTGQRWGNPVYDWDANERDGYRWWIERLRTTFERFDAVRIDHFRGFEAAWEIPAHEKTAMRGRWVPGPGDRLFAALEAELGELPIVVEDLGIITDEVRALRDRLGYPGMAVLQFAFEGGHDNPYLPRNQVENSVVFTGTHDNDTTLGWWESLPESHRHVVRTELSIDGSDIVDDLIRAAYASVGRTVLIPMQDVLKLGGEARMNRPAVLDGNWGWRFEWRQLPSGRAAWLRKLAAATGRLPLPTGGSHG
jgi:4-alpha-glucanotransferase